MGRLSGCSVLFIILFLFKVGAIETCVMGWSWWVITLPLWFPLLIYGTIVLSIITAILGTTIICYVVDKR